MEIKIERAKTLKEKPNQDNLGFGNYFTDHMFMMDYTEGTGWHDARIVPYAPIPMDPATGTSLCPRDFGFCSITGLLETAAGTLHGRFR